MTGWVISLPPHYATDVVRAESRQRGKVLAKRFLSPESYYTYRSSDAVAGRGSYGHDVRAGYSPWPGVPRGTL